MVRAIQIGAGSFLAFGSFPLAGPFTISRLNISEPQALLLDGFLVLRRSTVGLGAGTT